MFTDNGIGTPDADTHYLRDFVNSKPSITFDKLSNGTDVDICKTTLGVDHNFGFLHFLGRP